MKRSVVPSLHSVNPGLANRDIRIVLVGVGGNGCRMLHGLAQLHLALVALRGYGFHVTSFDPDVVSEANVGRTVFSLADIGLHKADVLTHRINCAYGLDWCAEPARYKGDAVRQARSEILITCVDSAASRREIFKGIYDRKRSGQTIGYWLDLGNSQNTGQVVLGEPFERGVHTATGWKLAGPRLPCVTDLFPEILDPHFVESNVPSCSLQEAIQSQDLFINAHVATWALQLLWELFRNASISRHGYFVNLETGHANPLTVESSLRMCFGGKG